MFNNEKGYKSILCLNGDLPDKKFFITDKLVIAADGAANKLLEIGVTPDVIIGDLDSIKQENYQNSKIVYIPDQNSSDFQKSINYLKQNNLFPAIICGVNGGFLDHIIFNINVILEHECIFYAPPIIGYTLKNGSNFIFEKNTKISLFGMPRAKVTTHGLKWELDNNILEFPGISSAFNRTIQKNISIEILEGTLLVLVYEQHIVDMGFLIDRKSKQH